MLFAVCERIIVSADENAATLVQLNQGFMLPAGLPIGTGGRKIQLPFRWQTYAQFDFQGESPAGMSARFELKAPSGSVLQSVDTPFAGNQLDRRFQRVMTHNVGFPVPEFGDYTVTCGIVAPDGTVTTMASYSIPVAEIPEKPSAPAP